jgi:GT2 family glycosyltransferase
MGAPDDPRELAAVTVAISTRDRPRSLATCLESLFTGRVLPHEIVVVDQSRLTEGTELPTAPAPVSLVHMRQRAAGLAVSQNEAVRRALNSVVAVIDDDCVAAPDWLGEIERIFQDDPSLGLVAGRVLALGPDRPGLYPVSLRVGERRLHFAGKASPWQLGSGNNFAVSRDRFLAVGGCDERLGPGARGLGAMDMDLFYRLLSAGARARYEPSVIVYHERKPAYERRTRRFDYGYGMGAFCRLRLHERDRYGLRLLLDWIVLRLGLLRVGLRERDRTRLGEELLVLAATARGLALFSPGASDGAGRT